MNRREAIAALMALPAVTRISMVPVQPNDIIVVETHDHLSPEACERIKDTMRQVWPGRKVAVLGKGMTLKVVAGCASGQE